MNSAPHKPCIICDGYGCGDGCLKIEVERCPVSGKKKSLPYVSARENDGCTFGQSLRRERIEHLQRRQKAVIERTKTREDAAKNSFKYPIAVLIILVVYIVADSMVLHLSAGNVAWFVIYAFMVVVMSLDIARNITLQQYLKQTIKIWDQREIPHVPIPILLRRRTKSVLEQERGELVYLSRSIRRLKEGLIDDGHIPNYDSEYLSLCMAESEEPVDSYSEKRKR